MKFASKLGSFARSARVGECSAILSIFTGFFLIHDRKMSYMTDRGAFVFREPARAWDLETVYPACSSADLEELSKQTPVFNQRKRTLYHVTRALRNGRCQTNYRARSRKVRRPPVIPVSNEPHMNRFETLLLSQQSSSPSYVPKYRICRNWPQCDPIPFLRTPCHAKILPT